MKIILYTQCVQYFDSTSLFFPKTKSANDISNSKVNICAFNTRVYLRRKFTDLYMKMYIKLDGCVCLLVSQLIYAPAFIQTFQIYFV